MVQLKPNHYIAKSMPSMSYNHAHCMFASQSVYAEATGRYKHQQWQWCTCLLSFAQGAITNHQLCIIHPTCRAASAQSCNPSTNPDSRQAGHKPMAAFLPNMLVRSNLPFAHDVYRRAHIQQQPINQLQPRLRCMKGSCWHEVLYNHSHLPYPSPSPSLMTGSCTSACILSACKTESCSKRLAVCLRPYDTWWHNAAALGFQKYIQA